MKLNYYYINLKRNKERRAHIEKQLSKAGIMEKFTKIDAVDGQSLALTSLDQNVIGRRATRHLQTPLNHRFGLDLTPGAAGLAITYYRLLKRISEGTEAALVLEDDAQLQNGFELTLERILKELPEKWDLVYLGFSVGAEGSSRPFSDTFVIPEGQLNGTHAFMVSPEGAAKLLDECFPLTYQIDTEFYQAFPKLLVFRLKTSVVKVAEFRSDIQNV